jgi:hypothetical protein
MMRTGEIKRFQRGFCRFGQDTRIMELLVSLNKRLFALSPCFTIPGDFGFDSPPRVCFLSVSGAAGWKSLGVLFADQRGASDRKNGTGS